MVGEHGPGRPLPNAPVPQPRFAQVAGITSDKFVPKRYYITDTGGV